jgi:hypothetical protein
MAFLDNNIITLDAVLTDLGRKRLAQGNGSFKVAQFALGDDEINYGIYNPNNTSGSAYYDLNILQTPIFEASTNATTALKYNLLTLNDNSLLYLPTIKLNTLLSGKAQYNGSYVVVANDAAYTTIVGSSNSNALTRQTGFTDGRGVTSTNRTGTPTIVIQMDQGVDNAAFGSPDGTVPVDLNETQFAVYMNSLFLEPVDFQGTAATSVVSNNVFNSLDNTAVYNLSTVTTPNYFTTAPTSNLSPIAGPNGGSLQFGVKGSTTLLNNLSYYFSKYGASQTNFASVSGLNVKVISTVVKVKGLSLGFELSLPIQLIAQF